MDCPSRDARPASQTRPFWSKTAQVAPHVTRAEILLCRLGSNSGDDDLFTPLMGELEIIEEHGPTVVATDNHLCLDLSTMPLWQQLRTPEWIGFLIFFNIQLLASTYFMTAVGDQLSCVVCGCGGRCFDPTCMQACTPENHQRGDQWLMAFGVIYPLGFITTPLCGYLQDRYASRLARTPSSSFTTGRAARCSPLFRKLPLAQKTLKALVNPLLTTPSLK
jgi:hypothetical protein